MKMMALISDIKESYMKIKNDNVICYSIPVGGIWSPLEMIN
ncbi:hypothetical protein NMY3_01568 [Candidatus Nitrosocosmicus oleophilus]|jgi:hypothetical protein|uniref:Uncharacterized protein n=1 Tax=Candidatus Nitrosocosmicus oleophilus TaxID=1353260 RepID=A0A654LZS4_9ARCH|nr:hypothetical protein NMY3_01568 [Candidatus Nitrosocosmicus oleophilus]